ncbi:MAG: hypothetical protein H0U06_07225 [Solirubrobacterales bacterium]|nr:hypothetical protein [Solirubrobacterales bacterium]
MKFDQLMGALGRGLIAGAAGTAAMTVSSTLEAKLRDSGSSSAPADAAGAVLGVAPKDDDGAARFSTVVHWGYGTGWGVVRGLLGAAGLHGPTAMTAHWAAVSGSSLAMLPALDIAPAPWKQEGREVAVDALHHLIYAAGTSVAYAVPDR